MINLIILFSLINCLVGSNSSRIFSGTGQPQKRILNGDAAGSVSYYVKVQTQYIHEDGTGDEAVHFCGGSLIGSRWVLTLASCVEKSDLTVVYFNYNGVDAAPMTRNVIKTTFPTQKNHDIAVLRLSSDVPFDPVPMCGREHSSAYEMHLIGMGLTKVTPGPQQGLNDNMDIVQNTERPSVLQRAVTMEEPCSFDLESKGYDPETVFCSGDFMESGVCPGDEGGPVVILTGEQSSLAADWCLYGLIGDKTTCSSVGEKVFVKVVYFKSWVEGVLLDAQPKPAECPEKEEFQCGWRKDPSSGLCKQRVEKVWIEQDCFYGSNKCGSWTLEEQKTCVSFVWNGSQCLQQKLNQNSDLISLDSDCKETEKRWKKCSNECDYRVTSLNDPNPWATIGLHENGHLRFYGTGPRYSCELNSYYIEKTGLELKEKIEPGNYCTENAPMYFGEVFDEIVVEVFKPIDHHMAIWEHHEVPVTVNGNVGYYRSTGDFPFVGHNSTYILYRIDKNKYDEELEKNWIDCPFPYFIIQHVPEFCFYLAQGGKMVDKFWEAEEACEQMNGILYHPFKADDMKRVMEDFGVNRMWTGRSSDYLKTHSSLRDPNDTDDSNQHCVQLFGGKLFSVNCYAKSLEDLGVDPPNASVVCQTKSYNYY